MYPEVSRENCLPGCIRIDGHSGRDPGACMDSNGVIQSIIPYDLAPAAAYPVKQAQPFRNAFPRAANWTAPDGQVRAQNRAGRWVPSIPLPFYGMRKGCSCGKRFWTAAGYRGHYALVHILDLD